MYISFQVYATQTWRGVWRRVKNEPGLGQVPHFYLAGRGVVFNQFFFFVWNILVDVEHYHDTIGVLKDNIPTCYRII